MRRTARKHFSSILTILIISLLFVGKINFAQAQACTSKNNSGWPTSRNVKEWPFATNSLWNMPIGCDAKYVNAKVKGPFPVWDGDHDIFIITKSSDPLTPFYKSGGIPGNGTNKNIYGATGGNRCRGTVDIATRKNVAASKAFKIKFPKSFILPSAGHNYATAILGPDGDELRQLNALARCKAGGPAYGLNPAFVKCTESIRGSGNKCTGGHGGSGLSSIGGTLRAIDFMNDEPIRHPIKIALRGYQYHCGDLSKSRCQPRWPAKTSDVSKKFKNGNSNPAMKMGALLALHKNATYQSLGIKTKAGRKLFDVFQDYGAYTSDGGNIDSPNNRVNISISKSAEAQFKRTYGHEWRFNTYKTGARYKFHPSPGTAYSRYMADIQSILSHLYVISDNGPASIGGHGNMRRRPLAPNVGNSNNNNVTAAPRPPVLQGVGVN